MRDSSTLDRGVQSPERLRLLFDLSRGFAELLEPEDLLPRVNDRVREVLGAESCAILILDPERNELTFPVSSDLRPEIDGRIRGVRFPADRSIAGWVVRHGEATIVDDVSRDERFYPEVDRQSGARTRNLLYAPLRTRRGVIGVIGVRNKLGGPFTADDLAFLDALAGSVAVAIENARLYAELKSSEERLRTEVGALRRDLARHDRFAEIVGAGEAMAEVFRLMESAAASPIPVLIQGETGTGKELVARAI
ncbi:MAG: GAF domain-containing protein, partial [Candidatus Binatia bacterium]